MGDDEQETEVAEYETYIEDPPDNLVIAEDDEPTEEDEPAGRSAPHETRGE